MITNIHVTIPDYPITLTCISNHINTTQCDCTSSNWIYISALYSFQIKKIIEWLVDAINYVTMICLSLANNYIDKHVLHVSYLMIINTDLASYRSICNRYE